MMNYLKKFALEILPSVAATVIGAYIVNHYVSKPATDAPVAAAVSPAEARKPAEATNLPQPGVKAKGISERAMMERSASEKPGEFKPAEAHPSEAKASDKPSEVKSTETASAPAEPRRHTILPAPREKTVARTTAPAPAASPVAPAETAAAPTPAEDRRDANDLARAAIERLRDSQPKSQDKNQDNKTQEASRAAETPRLQEAPRTVAPAPAQTASVRPLPPPITVTPPPAEAPANTASIRNDDPSRPTPPAEIPPPPPIDLRADASKLATRTNNMAQDVLHAAKSMFHAVLPNSDRQQSSSSSASQFTD
jgi:hypothetical protein